MLHASAPIWLPLVVLGVIAAAVIVALGVGGFFLLRNATDDMQSR